MTSTPLLDGYESVPVVRRARWSRIVVAALVVGLSFLGVWTAVARAVALHGPDRSSSAVAWVTSCDRIGPLSRGGVGFYWLCTADVVTSSGRTDSVRFGLNQLTPQDIGRPVPVVANLKNPRRSTEKAPVPWWSVAPGIGFFVGIGAWSGLRRRNRLRHRTTPWCPTVRLVSSTCVLAPADTSGTGHGSRKIAPGEWSAQRYWRLAGSVMVVGAVCATVGAVVSSADAREILLALGGFGLAAPIWVYSFTPRWYRTNSASTALTVSADGIGWYRRGQTSFELDWAEVAEVRLTTIEHGGLTLRVIDLFLAKDAGELRGLWQLGAELQNDRLPGEEGACRIPEAFSDAAARQVREAMAVYRPDRYREFTAEVGDMTVAA